MKRLFSLILLHAVTVACLLVLYGMYSGKNFTFGSTFPIVLMNIIPYWAISAAYKYKKKNFIGVILIGFVSGFWALLNFSLYYVETFYAISWSTVSIVILCLPQIYYCRQEFRQMFLKESIP